MACKRCTELLSDVERLRAEVQRHEDGLPCYCPKCGSCGETGCCGLKCLYLPEHTESAKWYDDEIERLTSERDKLRMALETLSDSIEGHPAETADEAAMQEWFDIIERALSKDRL